MSLAQLSKKLRLDVAKKVLVVNAPESYLLMLETSEFDTKPLEEKRGNYDFVQIFATSQAEMERSIIQLKGVGKHDCIFWACYPKGTGKIKSDMKRETVWTALELISLQAVSQIAIDDTWSALRGRPYELVGK